MAQQEVGEYETSAGAQRIRLSDDVVTKQTYNTRLSQFATLQHHNGVPGAGLQVCQDGTRVYQSAALGNAMVTLRFEEAGCRPYRDHISRMRFGGTRSAPIRLQDHASRLHSRPMARLTGSPYPRVLELTICEAIGTQRLLEFDYGGYHRVVQPYCHGFTGKRAESLRAVQVNADSRSGGRGFGKLWTVAKMQNLRVAVETFDAVDPDYNPNDTAMPEIHCRVQRAPQPRRRPS